MIQEEKESLQGLASETKELAQLLTLVYQRVLAKPVEERKITVFPVAYTPSVSPISS